MNLEMVNRSEKKPITKEHLFYNSIYMKCPEQAGKSVEIENRFMIL